MNRIKEHQRKEVYPNLTWIWLESCWMVNSMKKMKMMKTMEPRWKKLSLSLNRKWTITIDLINSKTRSNRSLNKMRKKSNHSLMKFPRKSEDLSSYQDIWVFTELTSTRSVSPTFQRRSSRQCGAVKIFFLFSWMKPNLVMLSLCSMKIGCGHQACMDCTNE